MLQEFKAFLTKSNALALAVGVIIGAARGKVVSGVVDELSRMLGGDPGRGTQVQGLRIGRDLN